MRHASSISSLIKIVDFHPASGHRLQKRCPFKYIYFERKTIF
ncbi:hypothetical protein HDF13_001893 [Edaphobacter lichenicola]|uniref:Uncharacterized protein n=1 Tax=Tunturiibacter gelidiferens TaxID=3069689 RepID=A0ACC5NYL8_9BACT|nr:hypothetical protein [Edaphobacter lichenicola]